MFCSNCGKEIDDNAVVCVNCGVATGKGQPQQTFIPNQTNGFAIAGFVLAFFAGLLGLIFSIVGLQKANSPECNGNGKGLAIAGIVISCTELFVYIMLGIILSLSVVSCAALSTVNSSAPTVF